VIVPAFEETFYISTQIARLSQSTKVFASPFSTLARLHDKGVFQRLVTRLGLPVPETVVVTSDDELRDASDRLEKVLRPGRLLARRGVLSDEYQPAGWCVGDRRGSSVAGVTVAGAAVPGR
jgi:predicted ATP-grasp superfamily ATP-dependent carboligase